MSNFKNTLLNYSLIKTQTNVFKIREKQKFISIYFFYYSFKSTVHVNHGMQDV